MSNARADADFEDTPGEDLPWLEPAELEYSENGGFLTRKAIIVGGITIAVVIALLWWVADQFGGGDIEIPQGGDIPLVAAPEGPYRIAPDDPGGMPLAEDELAMHSVAEGNALPGDVATDNLPEVPVPIVPPVGTGNADGPPRDLIAEAAQAKANAAAKPEPAQARPRPAPKPEPKPEPKPNRSLPLSLPRNGRRLLSRAAQLCSWVPSRHQPQRMTRGARFPAAIPMSPPFPSRSRP